MLRRILGMAILGIITAPLYAQTAADYAIPITVQTQASPPKIMLQWKPRTGATAYTLSRKTKSGTSFSLLATLGANDSSYTDATVALDSCYEYAIRNTGTIAASGYVLAGIQAAPIHHRGTMILVVDSTFTDSCRVEIAQLMKDLRGDGWDLIRHDISRAAKDTLVKSIIHNDYTTRSGVNALFILGHVAVPYSGDLNPDGHPDHRGAWPTDAYYSDMNGNWADAIVNDSTTSRSQNKNIPGDGKWDPTYLPTDVELQTGRVDFANMPSMPRSEVAMMRNYLNKAHAYKSNFLSIRNKALVDDNFGAFYGEAFAANAWRNFPVLVGAGNIVTADMISTLKDSAYLWAYGCGGGTYTSAGGIGKTADYDSIPVKGIFMMTFGSYFGDWDATDNFLRAPLCAPEPALVNAWAGRPNWFVQAMGLGESIGYCTRITQNNTSLYTPSNFGAHWIHVGLMGDPSLRDEYIKPVTGVNITAANRLGATISWTASADTGLLGYYIYRSDSAWRDYQLISTIISGTSFQDTTGTDGKKYYLIRPAKLQITPSGSYINLGIGVNDSAQVTYPTGIINISSWPAPKLYPNPATNTLNIIVGMSGNSSARLIIMDLSGRVLYYKNVPPTASAQVISLDVSKYPSGNYLIEWRSSEGNSTQIWMKW